MCDINSENFVIYLNSYGLGFLGNLLSFIIFYSLDEFRKISTGFFFLLSTISNSFHLWTLITEFFTVFNIYVYPDSFFQCRFNYFLQNVSRAISTYLAIGISLDRLIRSELPLPSRRICTRRNSIIYTFIVIVLFSILWSPWLSPTIIRDPTTGNCIFNTSPSIYFYISQFQTPFRLIVVCIIPVIIMAVSNIRMLYNMRQSRRRVRNRIEVHTVLIGVPPTTTIHPNVRRMSALDRMLLYMMLANVCTFIITQIPFNTYTIARSYYQSLDASTHSFVRTLLLIWSAVYFGVVFYLYCLTSPLFREKFILISKKLLRFIKRQPT